MYFSSNKEKICKSYMLFALIISVIEFIIKPIVAACASGYFTTWLISFFNPFASVYYWAVVLGAVLCALLLRGKEFKNSDRIVPIVITFVLFGTAVNALFNIFSTAGIAVDFGPRFYNWGAMVTGLLQLAAIAYLKVVAKYYKVFVDQVKDLVSCFKPLKQKKETVEEVAVADEVSKEDEPIKEPIPEADATPETEVVEEEPTTTENDKAE